nr:RNA-directed DNA polymerase, eukaryota, reverse transcriptase zinc-binding domain protein [Tanacetum cinerariifolium]
MVEMPNTGLIIAGQMVEMPNTGLIIAGQMVEMPNTGLIISQTNGVYVGGFMAPPVSSGSKFSNESLLERLSCNIFITNFPTTLSAKELWNTCVKYGTVLDVYIPEKTTKMGKRFAFARYHKVHDVDALIRNLRSVWLGSFHLYANVARFNRDSKSSFSQKSNVNEPLNSHIPSFARVVKGPIIQERHDAPVMVLERGTLNYEGNPVLVGCVKEFKTIPNIHHICSSKGFNGIKTSYLGGFWTSNFEVKDRVVWIDVEGTPLRAWSHATFQKIASKWGELVHMDLSNVSNKYSMRRCVKTCVQHLIAESFKVVLDGKVSIVRAKEVTAPVDEAFPVDQNVQNVVSKENISVPVNAPSDDPFELADLIRKSSKKRNINDVKESKVIPPNSNTPAKDGTKQVSEDNEPKFPLGFTPSSSDLPLNNEKTVQDDAASPVSMRNSSNRPDFNELGQTKTNQDVDGKSDIESKNKSHGGSRQDHVDSMAQPTKPVNDFSILEHFQEFISIGQAMGYGMNGCEKDYRRIITIKAIWGNVYLDFATSSARAMGDFNEVRCATKRHGSSFHVLNAAGFNSFIANSHLIDISLGGYSFTWSNKYASKMSNFDQFLVSQAVLDLFPNMLGLILHRHISDHRPILLRQSQVDYGPTPFCLFHSWFLEPDFASIVEDAWNNDGRIKEHDRNILLDSIRDIDSCLDKGVSRPDDISYCANIFRDLLDMDKKTFVDLAQKAKVKWVIEGDENSKYFYGMVNKKRRQLALKGILVDGEYVNTPSRVKFEFYNHFENRFSTLDWDRVPYEGNFTRSLGTHRAGDLEIDVTEDEIKRAVSSKLSSWKAKTLLVGGRLTLIKSVLGVIPTYYMSLYKAPEGVLTHLESLRNSFFLGANVGERKITWVCWRKVMAHKQLGGIRVSSLYALNLALLFKWIWRFRASRPALWISTIKAIHGDFGCLDCTISTPSGCSVWLGVLKAISKLKLKGVDVRLPRARLKLSQFNELLQLVSSVVLSSSEDRWAWTLDAHGVFFVKSARQAIDKHFLDKSSTSTRWSKILPININIFTWHMFLDKFPIKSNLSARGVFIPCTLCTNCGRVAESRNHLFFGCSMASDLFQLLGRWWNIQVPMFFDPSSWESWFVSLRLSSLQKRTLEASFFSLWWHVWVYRNGTLFSEKKPLKGMVFDNFVSQTFIWVSNRCRKFNFNRLEWLKDPLNAISM